MGAEDQDDGRLVRYLLGELSEAERARLEEQFFQDDELFEQLLAVEADLIDAYARGQLAAPERGSVERRILATESGRSRLGFARALASRAAVAAPESGAIVSPMHARFRTTAWNRPLVGLLAAASLVVVAVVVWLAFDGPRSAPERAGVEPAVATPGPAEPPRAHTPTETNAAPKPDTPLPPAPVTPERPPAVAPRPADRTPRKMVAFSFAPELTRGVEELRTLRIPNDAQVVRLKLGLAPEAPARLAATLRTSDGETVLTRGPLSARGAGASRAVTLDVEAARLTPAEYVVTLSKPGGEVVGDYIFKIERE